MSDAWRIFVVDEDEALNQHIANTLRKDGYVVRSVLNGADAVRVLWSEEFDMVLCDLKTPGADGFELLQWLRAYRPNTQMIMVGTSGVPSQRVQALESGAVSYLEKPLDLRVLKDELRRLQQQNGFTASLDSFDLLDVIQIITMSRKSITLLINIGLEERGVLRFQNGELIWAEYGVLLGEEAFFALAAHKNGTVTQQLWDEQVTANVTQPLSRLIFQALQYRSKYADRHQYTGEMEVVKEAPTSSPLLSFGDGDEIDDSPFLCLPEEELAPLHTSEPYVEEQLQPTSRIEPIGKQSDEKKEWWERTDQMNRITPNGNLAGDVLSSTMAMNVLPDTIGNNRPSTSTQPVEQLESSVELPSWLTDQPTAAQVPVRPPTPSGSQQSGHIPATPRLPTSSDEWQMARPQARMTEDLSSGQAPAGPVGRENGASSSSPAWQASLSGSPSFLPNEESVQNPSQRQEKPRGQMPEHSIEALQDSNPSLSTATMRAQRLAARRNYAALVSALQTLGYSITGFIAAAVITIEGQPVAQVAIDDLDISTRCKHFSAIQKGILHTLAPGEDGEYVETVISTSQRHILMRAVGSDKKAFLVLMTTYEASPAESLEVMANVEGAISAALR